MMGERDEFGDDVAVRNWWKGVGKFSISQNHGVFWQSLLIEYYTLSIEH